MLRRLRLAKAQFPLSLATRDCAVSQHRPIASAVILWKNCVIFATFDSKNSVFKAISNRCYSSKSKDTNLFSDDKFDQRIPTSESIKSLKSTNISSKLIKNKEAKLLEDQKRKVSKQTKALKLIKAKFFEAQKLRESKQDTARNLKEAKFLEAQKLTKSKLLEAQKLRISKQTKALNIIQAKLLEDQKLRVSKKIKDLKLKKAKFIKALKIKTYKIAKAQKLKDAKFLRDQKLKLLKQAKAQKLKEAKQSKAQKLKEAKQAKAQKLKEAKFLRAQKLKDRLTKNIIKQRKKDELEKLKLQKKLTASKELVLPFFPNSAFRLYTQDEFAKAKKDSLNSTHLLSSQKILTNISTNWKLISEAERMGYEQKYKLLKEQFTIGLYKWWDNVDKNLVKLENCRRRSINKIRKNKSKYKLPMLVDPRVPKRPAGSYAMFVKDLKKSNLSELPNQNNDFIKYADCFKLYKELLNKND
ncbi:hypothetical protein BB561_006815 [Smittium simulii]|uniref:HMG box domain-containing protein n=1 Tax=Smittium simulii TaxID=133385 RepID=A0A2T9Y197_9FUNG|nr:hypothetical protein BB561_006815 [Smittium simulii]